MEIDYKKKYETLLKRKEILLNLHNKISSNIPILQKKIFNKVNIMGSVNKWDISKEFFYFSMRGIELANEANDLLTSLNDKTNEND